MQQKQSPHPRDTHCLLVIQEYHHVKLNSTCVSRRRDHHHPFRKGLNLNLSMKIESAPRLREMVATRLRQAISVGEFHAGDRLIERELCESMGVSRTSVREALRELESEGLISMLPNRGPIVALLSIEQARSIYEARIALEVLATKLFTERASDEQRSQLQQAVRLLEEAYAGRNPQKMIAAKSEFYSVLLEGSGNEVISQMLRVIHIRVSQLRITSLSRPERAEQSIAEIRAMTERIEKRDPQGAAALCQQHLENAAATALGAIASKPK
ncbi:GntR family transcriptional regulator [Mesorhizobium sp. CAU 1741]|uniref:GntR family transcriptional regulator n=1 Tax=Mesorhizobium sp. CAU 1741 TaxID=3140366 RepID=UPI00325AAC9F